MANLTRFSRSSDMRGLQREIDRVFDTFFRPISGEGNGEKSAVWSPRVDLAETENEYLIHVDVPGISKDDIEINFQDNTLSISGERRAQQTDSDERRNYVRVERSFGHFYRSFTLPNTVDIDKIEANHENGVLTVRIPKAEEMKPRRIEVS